MGRCVCSHWKLYVCVWTDIRQDMFHNNDQGRSRPLFNLSGRMSRRRRPRAYIVLVGYYTSTSSFYKFHGRSGEWIYVAAVPQLTVGYRNIVNIINIDCKLRDGIDNSTKAYQIDLSESQTNDTFCRHKILNGKYLFPYRLL